MKAICIHENGGPEVLRYEDCELPAPAPGEARVRHSAIAVNFSDVNVRRGGFYIADPENLRTVPKPRRYFQKGTTHGVHYAVEFQGVLTVTDSALFRTTFTTGIGSAKAFGFGLLALAPLT